MRAQTEIIGLVFIVILVVLGIAFFSLRTGETDSSLQQIGDAQIAQSFLNSIMQTKTAINLDLDEVIKECSSGRSDICPTGCCNYAREFLENALAITLKEWNKEYELTTEPHLFSIQEGCSSFSGKVQPGYYYIPTSAGTVTVKLDVCY